MLQWNVEDEPGRGPPRADARTGGQRWRARALIPVVAVAALVGVAWRLQKQEEALRETFAGVVQRETRAMAFGQQAEAALLRDPTAPDLWAFLYDEQFRWARPIPVSPQVERVTLSEDSALVELSWLLEAGAGSAPVLEQRAYRRVGDGWVRTELPGSSELRQTDHWRLQGQPADLDAFEQTFRIDDLWAHLTQHWPEALGEGRPSPPTIVVEPQLFGRTVLLNADLFVVNAPRFAATLDPPEWERAFFNDAALAPEARYRLNVLEAFLYRTLRSDWARRLSGQPRADLLELYRQLIQAEVRQWALSDPERASLHAAWRETLVAQPVTLAVPLQLLVSDAERMTTTTREAAWQDQGHRRLALALWLDERAAESGPATLGRLTTRLIQRVETARDPGGLEWISILEEESE